MDRQTDRLPLLGVAALCILALAATISSGIIPWINTPFPGFLILENGVVASAGLAPWPAVSDGAIFQSRVVSYDGIEFANPSHLKRYTSSVPIGHGVYYTFESRTGTFERSIETRRFTPSDAFLLFGVMLISAVALLSVALALVYMAPRDSASAGCAVALTITGLFALTAVDLYGPYRFFRLHALTESFLGAGGIHMAIAFPQRRQIATKHPWLVPLAYGISAAIGIANQTLLFTPVGYTITHLTAMSWAGAAFAILVASQIEAFINPTSLRSRQRVTILALGTFTSITPAVVLAATSSITGGEAPENLISWTGVLFPVSVGYAVLKSDILEIDSVIRRTVNYVLLTVLVGIFYSVFLIASEQMFRESTTNSKVIPTIVFSLFLTFAMLPIRDRLQSWVDRSFFRSSYDFRHTVEDASNSLARMIELDLIRNRITSTVSETLKPERVDLVVLPPEESLESREARRAHPSTEALDCGSESFELEVPFESKDRTVAVLRLSRKLSGRPYSAMDRALLKVLANQGAIAIENALAVERLHDLNRTLEKRVEDRTAELESTLNHLTSTQAQLVQAERLAAVGELAAGVAHEINNPLNFARNSLRTLQMLVDELVAQSTSPAASHNTNQVEDREKLELAPTRPIESDEISADIKQLVEILGSGLDRTAKLVQELRDFAYPRQTKQDELIVSHLVIEALRLVGPTLREREIDVNLAIVDNEPLICGDSDALGQVMLNVLKNSIDALEGCRDGRISITIDENFSDSLVEVRITDSGPGIDQAVLPRLFEPFFSTKPAGKGTGLGLPLCRRIVNEHDGRIFVLSDGRSGTTVKIEIPTAAKKIERRSTSQLPLTMKQVNGSE